MWPDIVRIYHCVKKRSLARNVTKARPNQIALWSGALTRNRLLRVSKASELLIFGQFDDWTKSDHWMTLMTPHTSRVTLTFDISHCYFSTQAGCPPLLHWLLSLSWYHTFIYPWPGATCAFPSLFDMWSRSSNSSVNFYVFLRITEHSYSSRLHFFLVLIPSIGNP